MATTSTNTTGMSGGTNDRGQVCGVNHGHMELHVSEDRIKQLEDDTKKEADIFTRGMIKVAALDLVLQKLTSGTKWVTISGNPGEGKTTLGYMVLKQMRQEGKRVFRATTPAELETLKFCENSVVLLDDIFGACLCNPEKLSEWETSIHRLLELQNKTSDPWQVARVILVSRTNVLAVAKVTLERHSILSSSSLVDCNGGRDIREKMEILNYHLEQGNNTAVPEEVREKVVETDSPYGFPHCCRMFVDLRVNHNLEEDIVAFFSSPLQFLDKTTHALAENRDNLSLFKEMIRNDGQLDITAVDDEEKRIELQEASHQLLKSYLVEHDDYLVFSHQSIYESVAQTVAKKDIRFIIESANLTFLQEKVNIIEPGQETAIGYINLKLNQQLILTLATRFKPVVSSRKFNVFGSQLARSPRFCESLIERTFLKATYPSEAQRKKLELLDVNTKDYVGKTPLHYAIAFETYAAVRYLLQLGADVNIKTGIGMAPLHFLCRADKPDLGIMNLLLEHDADMNIKDSKDYKTPLHFVCATNCPSFDMAKVLIEHKADVNSFDADFMEPIHHLCSSDRPDIEIVKLLVDHEDEDHDDVIKLHRRGIPSVRKPLHRLCHSIDPQIDIIKFMLERKGGVNLRDKAGWTPLHCLCDAGHPHPDIVKLLLEQRANVNIQVRFDLMTPLHYLCRTERPDVKIVRLFIKHNANVNIKDAKGRTPLYCLCLGGNPDVEAIKLLIEHDDDVNIQVEEEGARTLLHLMCVVDHPDIDIIKLLVEHDADVNKQDREGWSPLHYLCHAGRPDDQIVKYLLNRNADVNILDERGRTPLHHMCTADLPDAHIVKMLIEHKADVNIKDRYCGRTPLHWFCSVVNPDAEIVKLLANSKADVNLQDGIRGMTPLHCLCSTPHQDVDVVRALIEQEADVNIRDRVSRTPLHYLCMGSQPSIEIIQLLIGHNADVNIRDLSDRAPLDQLSRDAPEYNKIAELLAK